MTNAQKIQIRQSEIRERLNVLSSPDTELNDEGKAEMNKLMSEMAELEPKLRAAITAEQEAIESRNNGDSEDNTKLADLRKRASVSEYIRQAVSGNALEGACRELNDELKITAVRGHGGGVLMPVEQLALRLRADTPNTTSTSSAADETQRRPIYSRLFARGVLEAMGIRIDPVPVGMIEYPILTDSVSPAMTAEGADKDTEVASFTSQVLKPKRLLARYEFTAESAATVPGLDAALSADLQMATTSQMSKIAIGDGDGTGHNVRGLGNAIDFKVANIANPAAVVTQTDALAWPMEVIDGLHASTEAEVSIVIGPETYKKLAVIMFANTTENIFDVWRKRGINFVSSAHIEAASNIERVYVHGGRDEARGDSVAAVWPAMELIRDPYTKAGESKTVVTAVMLWDMYGGFRSAAYKGAKAKVA